MSGPLAGPLDHPAVTAFDDKVDAFLERFRGRPGFDAVFAAASHLGDFALIWHLTSSLRGTRSERHAAEALRFSLLLGVESLVVNQGLKRLFRRTRPTASGDERYRLRTPSTSSFPSGHASAAFFSAVHLTRRSPGLAPLWWTMAIVVTLSRPFTRIHHASDVIGGALVGLALARLTRPWAEGRMGSGRV